MGKITLEQLKTEIKVKSDIKEYMEKDGVNFVRKTGGNYLALCPFHNEKTPSFNVNEMYQNYKCFGCGKSGDLISFVQEREHISFKDSILMLANYYGLEYELDNTSDEDFKSTKRAFEINQLLYSFYQSQFLKLEDSHPAKQEIIKRNLKIDSYDYGYAPEVGATTLKFLKKQGVTLEEMVDLNIAYQSNNQKYTATQINRLIFPIRNYMGKVVGVTGRALQKEQMPKYKNTSETILFKKKEIVFNISNAKDKMAKDNIVYLVEGQFDVVAMMNKGYENTVAISGTGFSEEQLRLIQKPLSSGQKIIMCLDGDEAGQKASHRIFKMFPEIHKSLYIIRLNAGVDPCEYLQVEKQMPEPQLYIEEIYSKIRQTHNLMSIEGKSLFLDDLQNNLTKYITDNSLKTVTLKKACNLIGVDFSKIKVLSVNKNKDEEVTGTAEGAIIAEQSAQSFFKEYFTYYKNLLHIVLEHTNIIKPYVDLTIYPKKIKPLVENVLSHNNQERFIPEIVFSGNTGLIKLSNLILNDPFDDIGDDYAIISHYQSLSNFLKNKIKQTNLRNKQEEFMIELEEIKTNDDVLALLRKYEEQSHEK